MSNYVLKANSSRHVWVQLSSWQNFPIEKVSFTNLESPCYRLIKKKKIIQVTQSLLHDYII